MQISSSNSFTFNLSRLSLSRNQQIIGVALLVFMVLTRFGAEHFGSAIKLPDASLAVFFLAGLYLQQWKFLPVYLIPAGISDYVVTHYFGVSDFCVTPAYGFLIPTYAALWFTGRGAAAYTALKWENTVFVINWLLAGVLVAFFVSNTSFYLLSGYVQNPNWAQYMDGWLRYFPRYLGYTTLYVVLAGFAHVVITALQNTPATQQDSSVR